MKGSLGVWSFACAIFCPPLTKCWGRVVVTVAILQVRTLRLAQAPAAGKSVVSRKLNFGSRDLPS